MSIQGVKIILAAMAVSLSIGCTSIDVPVTLAVEEPDSQITIELWVFGEPTGIVTGTTLVGGADMTVSLNLLNLFAPGGILAMVTIDDIRIAGPDFVLSGLHSGTLCVSDVPDSGGGTALIRPLHGEAQFDVVFDTVIHPLGPLGNNIPDGFAFAAPLNATAPLSFGDMIDLFLGKPGALRLTQVIQTEIEGPGDNSSILDLIDGSPVIAKLTLVSAEAIPEPPLLEECAAEGF
jgi:hypothetical protein